MNVIVYEVATTSFEVLYSRDWEKNTKTLASV